MFEVRRYVVAFDPDGTTRRYTPTRPRQRLVGLKIDELVRERQRATGQDYAHAFRDVVCAHPRAARLYAQGVE
jgi:hypothetical protein